MVNTSLRCGYLPASQKTAVVTPLTKKASLELHELKNNRAVSNLSFVSKLVERVAVKQLTDYLEINGLLPLLQSAYISHHSTETALLAEGFVGCSDRGRRQEEGHFTGPVGPQCRL